jgi:hypothetical protein
MAATASERIDSRPITRGDTDTSTRLYNISNAATEDEAQAALLAAAPATVDGNLTVTTWTIEPLPDDDPSISLRWNGTVNYAKTTSTKTTPETGESSFSFDTSGGSVHITQSEATVQTYAASGETAPNFNGAIGVERSSNEQTVTGCDITSPVYQFAETHYVAAATVNDSYKGNIFSLTGKVNSDTFRGCDPGECLFLGASGSKRSDADWEITFRFAASPNRTGLSIGTAITGIAKKGWEYLWVLYKEKDVSGVITKTPQAAYVEQVYETAAFSGLGLG